MTTDRNTQKVRAHANFIRQTEGKRFGIVATFGLAVGIVCGFMAAASLGTGAGVVAGLMTAAAVVMFGCVGAEHLLWIGHRKIAARLGLPPHP